MVAWKVVLLAVSMAVALVARLEIQWVSWKDEWMVAQKADKKEIAPALQKDVEWVPMKVARSVEH